MIKIAISRNKRFLFLVAALYIFVLQDYIGRNYFHWFGYFDELIAVYLGIIFLGAVLAEKRADAFTGITLVSFLVITFCAVASTLLNGGQPLPNVILDMVAILKFPVSFIGALKLFEGFSLRHYAQKLVIHVKAITRTFGILAVLDILFNLFPDVGYQFYKDGMKSMRLIYGHPATLAVVCLFLFSILFSLQKWGIKSNFDMAVLVVIMVLTFRAKIIGTIAILAALGVYIFVFNKKVTVSKLLLLAPFVVALAWDEIQSYYIINPQASRLMLTQTAVKIARDHFPLGSGLATFGSAFSIHPYSDVYVKYGLSNIWGLSPETSQDISDTFWPMIGAQLGVVALIAYIVFVCSIYFKIQKCANNKYIYMGCLIPFVYLLIASTSESAFVNSYAVFFAVYMALYLKTENRGTTNQLQENGKNEDHNSELFELE